jgi:hypothetical protein
MIMIMSLVIVLKIGVLGRNLLDEHREWWSRVGAWLTIVNLSWIVLFAFAMYSAYVFALADTAIKQAIVASGGLGWARWTGAGVLLGKDSGSAGGIRAALKNHRLRRWIVDMAPFVFIVGFLACGIDSRVLAGNWSLAGRHARTKSSISPIGPGSA